MAYPDPMQTSGPISMSQIATWMLAAGELNQTETQAPYALSFLLTKSHLEDKTLPVNISRWYGYSGLTQWVTTGAEGEESFVCDLQTVETAYSTTPTMLVGTTRFYMGDVSKYLVLNAWLSFVYNGERVKIRTDSNGVVVEFKSCSNNPPGIPPDAILADTNVDSPDGFFVFGLTSAGNNADNGFIWGNYGSATGTQPVTEMSFVCSISDLATTGNRFVSSSRTTLLSDCATGTPNPNFHNRKTLCQYDSSNGSDWSISPGWYGYDPVIGIGYPYQPWMENLGSMLPFYYTKRIKDLYSGDKTGKTMVLSHKINKLYDPMGVNAPYYLAYSYGNYNSGYDMYACNWPGIDNIRLNSNTVKVTRVYPNVGIFSCTLTLYIHFTSDTKVNIYYTLTEI